MLESKKEENSPQKRPPRWKIKVAKVRRVFETIRTRNPKLFDPQKASPPGSDIPRHLPALASC